MTTIKRRTVIAILFGAWYGTAHAQTIRIDHRVRTDINFADISPGDRVAENPNYVWGHDGQGWIWICNNPYACDVEQKPPVHLFFVGQHIRQPYPIYKAIVIGVTKDGEKTIVTARLLRAPDLGLGEYISFDMAKTQWYPEDRSFLP